MDENTQQLTKKERREIRRQERQSESSNMRRGNNVKRVGTWAVVILVVGLAFYGLSNLGADLPAPTGDGSLAVEVSVNDWIEGNLDSEITLVEYGDFQCPACGAYHPIIKQLVEDNGDQFRFVYRHFPLSTIHPNAENAGRAAEAAGLQGKFWEMHDILFERQRDWSNLSRTGAINRFAEYSVELGLDEDKYKNDFESSIVEDALNEDIQSGTASGINSTPTFYLNGQRITGPQNYEEFVKLLFGSRNPEPIPNP